MGKNSYVHSIVRINIVTFSVLTLKKFSSLFVVQIKKKHPQEMHRASFWVNFLLITPRYLGQT